MALFFKRGMRSNLLDPLAGPKRRQRIINTILLLLAFRILADIPLLHVDEERLNRLLADNPLTGLIDLLAGGEVLTHFSVAAAGLFPYLVALALVHGSSYVLPSLRKLHHQGERGKKQLEHYATWMSIPLAILFGWITARFLLRQTGLFPGQIHWFKAASFFPTVWIIALVTLGSVVSNAISGLITRKGIGNGENLVLCVGSSVLLCQRTREVLHQSADTTVALERLGWVALGGLMMVVLCISLSRGARLVPVESAKRRMDAKRSSPPPMLPLLLNSGGVQPILAATGVFVLLQWLRILLGSPQQDWFSHEGYWLTFAALIVLFTYVYNYSAIWQPFSEEGPLAEQWRKYGNFIPGFRPGVATQQYLSQVTARISLPGGLGLALLASGIPYAVLRIAQVNIFVGVLALMTMVKTLIGAQTQLTVLGLNESYDGLLRKAPSRDRQ